MKTIYIKLKPAFPVLWEKPPAPSPKPSAVSNGQGTIFNRQSTISNSPSAPSVYSAVNLFQLPLPLLLSISCYPVKFFTLQSTFIIRHSTIPQPPVPSPKHPAPLLAGFHPASNIQYPTPPLAGFHPASNIQPRRWRDSIQHPPSSPAAGGIPSNIQHPAPPPRRKAGLVPQEAGLAGFHPTSNIHNQTSPFAYDRGSA